MSKVRFNVGTDVTSDGLITQVLSSYHNDIMTVISQRVIDLQEAGVREALIKLGWTPPKEGENGV
jgi:hypothetical protein